MVESASELSVKVDAADVIRNRKRDRALRESEERYRLLFEQSPIGISITKLDGSFIDVNKTLQTILGYSKEELKKINVADLYERPEQRSTLLKAVQQHGAVSDFSVRLERKDGTVFDALLNVLQVHIGGKSLLQTTIQDVTERKKIEETLRESEEKYRNLFENARDTIYTHDLKGKISTANRVVEEYGFRRDQLIGKNMLKFTPKKYWPKLIKQLSDIVRGNPVEGEIEVITPIGKRNVEYRTNPIRQREKVIGAQTIMRDITERKKAEIAILEGRERFESLFIGSPEAMAHVDPRYDILDINPRFTELFGYAKEEANGKNLDSLIVPADRVEEAKELSKKAIEGYVYHDTVRNTKHGVLVPVSVSAAPIVVKGVLTGYIAVYKDISHLKKTEEELTITNEKLRVIGGLTRHDARNRLTLVTTNAYLAKECLHGNDEAEGYLGKIEGAVNDVVGIFDFAKLYEMIGVEKPTFTDVEKAVSEAVSLFSSLKIVKVIIDCHGLTVLADSLLRQAFYNLIDDSLKYAQNLTQIRVYYERGDDDRLRLIYEDNGVGIPFDKKPNLFQKGYTTGKGSGYGLYLIQKMMEIYGWAIHETGEPGKGARFVMEIPKLNKEGKELYRLNTKA